MKTILGIFLLCWSVALYAEDVQRRLNLENAINNQLTSELSALLPPKTFAIFTSAVVNTEHVKEISQGETLIHRASEGEKVHIDLPGFEDFNTAAQGENQQNERQVYRYVEKDTIESVAVKVLLEETLPAETQAMAKDMVNHRLTTSYGAKAQVTFQAAPLQRAYGQSQQGGSAPSSQASFGQFLRDNLFKIFAFAALMGLLGAFWRWLMARRRHDMAYQAAMQQAYPGFQPHAPFLASHDPLRLKAGFTPEQTKHIDVPFLPERQPSFAEITEAFINQITAEPLVARSFLKQLDLSNRKLLLNCFATSSIRDALEDLFSADFSQVEPDYLTNHEVSEEEKRTKLAQISQEFSQYKRLITVNREHPLARLAFLSPDEVLRLLEGLPPDEQASVLRHLTRQAAASVIKLIPDRQKKDLLTILSMSQMLTPEVLQELDQKIGAQIDLLEKEIFLPYSNSNLLMDLIIEEAEDTKALLAEAAKHNPQLGQKYRAHLLSFDDLLRDPARLVTLLDMVSNELIAHAIGTATDPVKKQILDILPPMRRGVVASLMTAMAKSMTSDKMQQARKEILKTYRASLSGPSRSTPGVTL